MQNEIVQIDAKGLIAPQKLSQEQWLQLGEKIGRISRGFMWLVGDWIRIGEDEGYLKRGKLQEACELFQIALQTAKDASYTSRRFALCERRPNLTYSHHQQVASREDREELLDWAEQSKATISDLRAEKRRRNEEPRSGDASMINPKGPVEVPTGKLSRKSEVVDREVFNVDSTDVSFNDIGGFISSAEMETLDEIRKMLWKRESDLRKERFDESRYPYMTPKQIVWTLRQENVSWSEIAKKVANAGHRDGSRSWSVKAIKELYQSISADNPRSIFFR